MKVQNMIGNAGEPVRNQFVIEESGNGALGNFTRRRTFQSYDSVIAVVTQWPDQTQVVLDASAWDYSKTTGRYRNLFLGETKAETARKIKSGEYELANLNG